MKKKALSNKLKLQKENIVNLNQLNSIKGGIRVTTGDYSDYCSVVTTDSVDPLDTITII